MNAELEPYEPDESAELARRRSELEQARAQLPAFVERVRDQIPAMIEAGETDVLKRLIANTNAQAIREKAEGYLQQANLCMSLHLELKGALAASTDEPTGDHPGKLGVLYDREKLQILCEQLPEVSQTAVVAAGQRAGWYGVPAAALRDPVRAWLREQGWQGQDRKGRWQTSYRTITQAHGLPADTLAPILWKKTYRMTWARAKRVAVVIGVDPRTLPPCPSVSRAPRLPFARLRRQRRAKDPRAAEAQVRLQAFTDEFARLWPLTIGTKHDAMYAHIYALRDFVATHVVREHVES